jgi:exoribonuclease R
MSQRRIRAEAAPIDFDSVRAELGIPNGFDAGVEREAEDVVTTGPWLAPDRPDRTDLPLVTLDPPGSMDLDQAVLIRRSGNGYELRYAIADVAAWVRPGTRLEAESLRRGLTLYSPDHSTPLHPRQLSEGAASLLPGRRRPAVLWSMQLDADAEPTSVEVSRAWVTSTAKLDYPSVQADLDAGAAHPSLALLADVGPRRIEASRERHAITLDVPEVEVVKTNGGWRLDRRAMLPVEQFNAEISLLTGMSAARIMLGGGAGILRTLPEPGGAQVTSLRRATTAMGIPWPVGRPPGDVIAELDGDDPRQAALLEQAAKLLRGAGYEPFQQEPPERTAHAGVGAPYAHVTAPLRRLVDRFGTEICLSLHTGSALPDWVVARLDELPEVMAAAGARANALEKACVGAVGTFLLAGLEGQQFSGTVLSVDTERDKAVVVLDDPPVRASCPCAGLVEGDPVTVELVSADPATHTYRVAPTSQVQPVVDGGTLDLGWTPDGGTKVGN